MKNYFEIYMNFVNRHNPKKKAIRISKKKGTLDNKAPVDSKPEYEVSRGDKKVGKGTKKAVSIKGVK